MAEASIRRDPDFRLFWVGETITFFGGAVREIALPFTAILVLDAGPAQMGVLVMLQTLPTLFVSLFAGVIIDRVRRRPIMVAGNVIRAVILTLVPVLFWHDALQMWHLYVIAATDSN